MDFFDLLRLSIGTTSQIPTGKDTNWDELYEMAKKQSLVGVLFAGIWKLPKAMHPEKKLLLKWYAQTEKLKEKNRQVNKAAVYIHEAFSMAGIGNCILKGQGNALLYDDAYLRNPGDIDLWIDARKMIVEKEKLVVGKLQLHISKPEYHHVESENVMGIPLEIHYRPSFLNNLVVNRRMQQWYRKMAQEQFEHEVTLPEEGTITIPTPAFNLVYQLSHITHHFLKEGIGLRQIVDYFFVLKNAYGKVDVDEVTRNLKYVGLYKMAKAVMYIERELLGLEDQYLIAPSDERIGRFLIQEIMIGGNFGFYDPRANRHNSQFLHNVTRLQRDMRLVSYFPSECLWEPIFRIYHFFWRRNHQL